ncbi:IQ calmodulin-binding motif-containing protein [Fusarium heterosporum]|uniref:IQ calmodulin-binding motif-containing protein n=1 Tax=Fusarium heterosporum TaxID=42747 RepID=A0A8H5TYR5_FUSHE|nr:IQ calmodulin-binding motif-containing protein [Fusarium heterosporum]
MVSQYVYDLCQAKDTVSSVLTTNPDQPPGEIIKKLYGHHEHGFKHDHDEKQDAISNADVLQTALQCGRWGPTTPSPLFLQAFADSLHCLNDNPMVGVVSPPLMGSCGTMPLTVIAPLADVMRHCSNLIARAEKEVFYITCSWSPSVAQALLKDALIELSRRAGKRGDHVVVKIMYDKPGPMNAITPHQSVKAKTYASKSIGLPSPDEIPNIDLQVITLHRLFLGTLHAKFCLVDRKIAAVMSNNTEDNDNLEMMTHVEGPIVDSIYDTAIITWQNSLNPALPTLDASRTGSTSSSATSGSDHTEEDRIPSEIPHIAAAYSGEGLPEHMPNSPHYDDDMEGEIRRMQSGYSMKEGESRLQAANRQLNLAVHKPIKPSGPEIQTGEEMTPYIPTSVKQGPVPMALVSRPPYGPIDSKNVHVPQNEAWLSLMKNAKRDIFIQTPDLNAAPLLPAIVNALKRGVEVTYYVCFGYNDPGEMIPGQGGTNDQIAQRLLASLPENGSERKRLHIYNYVGKDQDHPIHQSSKARSCHIKLLIVDGSVGIQGSGNQDTQSWFHSQEINLMVDSAEVCRKWREGIDRNQNTKKFGRVAADGIWRDAEGKPAKGYMGNPGQVMGLVKGVAGMVMKMKGAGGF